MSKTRAEQYKLVLAYDGVTVREAYPPNVWMSVSEHLDRFSFLGKNWTSTFPRIGFEGERASDVWDDYVGKRVPPRKKGEVIPFRYLVPGTNKIDPESPIEDVDVCRPTKSMPGP